MRKQHGVEVWKKVTEADNLAQQANGGQMATGNAVESYRESLANAYDHIAELEATIEGNDAAKKPAADQTGGFHPNTQWPSE